MSKRIKLYSTSACPYCQMAKDFLRQNKIKFEEIDVGASPAAARELIEKSGQTGVPVIEIDGKIIVGFDKAALKRALKLK